MPGIIRNLELESIQQVFSLLGKCTDDYLFILDFEKDEFTISSNALKKFAFDTPHFDNAGSVIHKICYPDDREALLKSLEEIREGRAAEHNMEYRVKTRKGEYVWISCRGRVGLDRDGNPYMFVGTMSRMAQRNQADEVTGLLNKYQFEHAVKMALAQYRATGEGGAIMVMGLDNFKIVNETYNRMTGDLVLKRVSDIIGNVIPSELTLFKLDGDEFALIYPGAKEQEVAEIFASVQSALSRPQDIEGHQYFCTASCGTVFYPEAGKDYLVLHKHAEAAMDIAKREGKNRNTIFSKEQYNRWVRSISMRDSIWESVENGCVGFSLFFQPQVSAGDQKLIGAEALLRWKNPKGRMVAPMEFIPILEETKLIIPVGKWVAEQAIKTCKKWRRYVPNFRVSVNMSYEQIKDLSFKKFVECNSGIVNYTSIGETGEEKKLEMNNIDPEKIDFYQQYGMLLLKFCKYHHYIFLNTEKADSVRADINPSQTTFVGMAYPPYLIPIGVKSGFGFRK